MLKKRDAALAVLASAGLVALIAYRPWANERTGVMISYGMTMPDIAHRLYEHGIIVSPWEFTLVSRVLGRGRLVKAGYYMLRKRTPAWLLLPILERGSQEFISVTIPEGMRAPDVAARLAADEIVDADRFLQLVNDTSLVRRFRLRAGSLEGYLFPDTYYLEPVGRHQEESVIEMMLDNFFRSTADLECGDSLEAFVTMASIIEKEARLDRERPVIASVFFNRLRRKRPIESCATVMYALAWKKSRLLESDLKLDSPYNTYRYLGLPPGPICSPGLKSIAAARHPDTTDYLYFVAKGDGGHIFSRTYQEHVAAKMLVKRYGKK